MTAIDALLGRLLDQADGYDLFLREDEAFLYDDVGDLVGQGVDHHALDLSSLLAISRENICSFFELHFFLLQSVLSKR